MLQSKKIALKKILTQQFAVGINKERLLVAIERFIDLNYELDLSQHRDILHDLVRDIKTAGGIEQWKASLAFQDLTASEKQKIIQALLGAGPTK